MKREARVRNQESIKIPITGPYRQKKKGGEGHGWRGGREKKNPRKKMENREAKSGASEGNDDFTGKGKEHNEGQTGKKGKQSPFLKKNSIESNIGGKGIVRES